MEQRAQKLGVSQADIHRRGLHSAWHPPVALPARAARAARAPRARPQAHTGDGAVARALRLAERVLHVGPELRATASALGRRRHHARQRLHVHRQPPAPHPQQWRARAQQRLSPLAAGEKEQCYMPS